MSEMVAELLPPSLTPQQEVQFHHAIDGWADDLTKRHGMADDDGKGGRLSVVPFDPDTYPFQDMSKGIILARVPSTEDIESMGREEAGAFASYRLKEIGYEAVGEENYEAMIKDMLEHDEGRTMASILELMDQPDSTVTVLLAHANLQDVPFAQVAMLDALSSAAATNDSGLDIFDIINQSYSYFSELLTRVAWDGKPIIDRLSGTANVVKIFPPTDRGVNLDIDRDVKKFINRRSAEELTAETARLQAQGRSRLDYVAPAGSTMDKVKENGALIGLGPKRINQLIGAQIAAESAAVLPLALWFEKSADNKMRVRWQVLELRKLNDRDEFNQTMSELNQATADLAGVPLITSQPESV